jgi:hypothetical protein
MAPGDLEHRHHHAQLDRAVGIPGQQIDPHRPDRAPQCHQGSGAPPRQRARRGDHEQDGPHIQRSRRFLDGCRKPRTGDHNGSGASSQHDVDQRRHARCHPASPGFPHPISSVEEAEAWRYQPRSS